ncbi:hypothetical protein M406DRAFT_329049 [Cryphonectria parasitica EP155]|uniref:PH domain-containing protein n=1 Tax=Cryphonectria parasitica (strain ATCC 38755 / EP155) TaxID=660469 RepID=A0A9P5CQY7_CRYP1|nr:uncharacterized protein M406DRAFT_329049 [Cryphonectria parasitica EP155]KAF3768004.1 hypothetical protein M406DRAFT_329049 [Cryphonectria parasitica EP155]
MRPPDLEIKATMDNRQALRGDKNAKAAKRESRLTFGRLFGRHKVGMEVDAVKGGTREAGESSKKPEVGSETIGGLPYDLQPKATQSDMQLASTREQEAALHPKTGGLRSPPFSPSPKSPALLPSGKRRGSLATTPTTLWDRVPLFQAWPQAIRTATLPACVQADHLLKMHNKKETAMTTISHPDLGDEKTMFAEMARPKKHRHDSSSFKLDWTSKIYMLVTSGYLLQYAGDGPHDCLPEKVVRLTKDSAAFASDVIPGRHWVLQVSSVFEDGAALMSQDTRSLLGKFGLREKEKRQASDCLMVFENVTDMEGWMGLLRKEIEVLSGKVPVTETGRPKVDNDQTLVGTSPRSPVSPMQRTLAFQDLNRFTRNGSMPDIRWNAPASSESPDSNLAATLAELTPDHVDSNSATNSFVSQDGQQLDALRDSSNRYSFMSIARTVVTSDSSACNSPIRDSFGSGSQGSHPSAEDATPLADELRDIRLRPNAAEIEDRRQSYRTSNIILESGGQYMPQRQHSSLSAVQEPPNFSLPNAAARRRAASQNGADTMHGVTTHTTSNNRPPRRPRRPPPPTLGFTRPLSVVADSPSPSRSSAHSSFKTDDDNCLFSQPPDSSSMLTSWAAENGRLEYDLSSSQASNRTSMAPSLQAPVQTSPRKAASTTTLRPAQHSSLWGDGAPQSDLPFRAIVHQGPPHDSRTLEVVAEVPRSMGSVEDYPAVPMAVSPRSRSPIQRAMAAQKRASVYSLTSPTGSSRRGSVYSVAGQSVTHSDHLDELFRSRAASPPPPSRNSRRESLLSIPGHSRNGSNGSAKSFLSNRRSMPHMPQPPAQGLVLPPLSAPPPNKALPPIPTRKPNRRSGSIPPRISVGIGGAF